MIDAYYRGMDISLTMFDNEFLNPAVNDQLIVKKAQM